MNRALRAATIGVLLIAPVALSSCSAGQIPQTSTQNRDKVGAMGTAGAIALREVKLAFPTGGTYRSGSDAQLVAAVANGGSEADQLVSITSDAFSGVRVGGTSSAPLTTSSALTSVPGTPVGTIPPGGAAAPTTSGGAGSTSASSSGSSSSSSSSASSATPAGPTTAATGIGGATGTPTSAAGQGASARAALPLPVPPGSTVYLGQNGQQVFVTGLSQTLTAGQVVRMTFTFQRAGTITVDSFVAGPTSYSPNSSSFNFELPSNASEPGVAAGGAGESAGGNG